MKDDGYDVNKTATACTLLFFSVACRNLDEQGAELAPSQAQQPPPIGTQVFGGCTAPTGQFIVQMLEASGTRESLHYFEPRLRDAVWNQKLGYVSASSFSFGDGEIAMLEIAVQTKHPETALPVLRRTLRDLNVPEHTWIEESVGTGAVHYDVWGSEREWPERGARD